MEPFVVWYGLKQTLRGHDTSSVTEVEFRGEFLGRTCFPVCGDDDSGVDTVFYRADDGRIVVHVVRWTRLANVATQADIYIYNNLEEAQKSFRLEMQRAGVIPPRRMTLKEFTGR